MSQPINYNLRSSGSNVSQLTETEDQHRMASRDDQVHVQPKLNVLLATSMLQPSMYDGTMKPGEWVSQFKKWLRLQKLNDEEAAHAISFYFTGPARIWYEGLPSTEQSNLQSILRLMEVRFSQISNDDILTAQMPNESVQEYLDRVTLKEKLHKTTESFLFTIIKRGLRPEFEDYNIQSEAKTLDDIKRAAITTEKVLHAKSSQLI